MLGPGPRRLGFAAIVTALVLAACAGGDAAVEVDDAHDGSTDGADASATTDSTEGTEASATTMPVAADVVADGPIGGVTLGVDRAAQLSRVGLVGLDPTVVDVTALMATYEFADGAWWGTRVLVDADGPYLLAPLNPTDPESGGELELYLSDGADEGPPLRLTVTAMPAAANAFGDALDAMRAEVDALAGELGSSWDELAATAPGETAMELAPLKFAQLMIDDGTEAGAAGAYEALEPAEAAFLDSIFGQLDLPSALGTAGFADVAPFLPEHEGPTGEPAAADATPQGFRGVHGFGPIPRQGAGCIPYFPEGGGQVSAGRLSEMMIGSAFSDIAINTNGTPGKTFAALELALSLGGALEAGATGGKGKVYETLGKGAGAWKLFNGMKAGLLPSAFTDIRVTLSPGDLEEDRPVSAPGTWPEVRVTAASNGYTLDGDIAAELSGAFGGEFMKTRLPKGAVDHEDAAIDWFHKLDGAADAGDLVDAAGAEPIKNAANKLLPAEGVISFCPQTFTADISGAEWSWARQRGNLLTIDNDAQTYVNTTDIGTDTIVIGPIPAKFGQKSIYADEPVVTKPIDVRIEPDTVYVTRPGDTVPITATIRDAYETKLGWYADKGTWSNGSGAIETPDGGTQVLTTPEEAGDFPIRIEVESLSRLNLREDGTPPRYDFVNVELAPFTIAPDPGDVTVEEQIQFTALDREGQPIEVEWRATGGTISAGPSSTAIYTAGRTVGAFTVTAWLPGRPDEQVTVTVNVGDKDCILGNWELDVPKFVAAMNQFADGGGVTYLSGDSQVIVRDDGTATWVVNDVRLRATADGQTFTLTWNSTVENGYSVDGGVFVGGGGTAAVSMYVDELGRGIDMTVPSAVGGTSTFVCTPRERLVVHTEDGDLHFTYNGPA